MDALRPLPPLLDVLPDTIFGPLASPNRRHYWRMLWQLFDEFFGPDAPLPPSAGYPRRTLVAALERYLQSDDPWADDDVPPNSPLSVRAALMLDRFRASGWLRQERIGAVEMLGMPPIVVRLVSSLADFAERGPAFLGAKVRSIELLVRQVLDGDADGDALDEAAAQARDLLTSVAAIGVQVRDLMPQLSQLDSTAQFARRLFEDYVGRLFIGDYAELHASDHPLSRKSAILGMLRDLDTPAARARLQAWYAQHLTGGDAAPAAQRLDRSLRRVGELDRIDEYLARLDDDIRIANRRALAFLDYRLRAPDHLDRLLARAVQGVLDAPDGALRIPAAAGGLLGESRLRPPRQPAAAIARSANRVRTPTPEQRARMALLKRIKRARLVLPEDLERYVARHLAPGGSLASEQWPVTCIEELRAYQTLLTIALRSRRGRIRRDDPLRRYLRGFRVELRADARSEGEHFATPAFTVHREER